MGWLEQALTDLELLEVGAMISWTMITPLAYLYHWLYSFLDLGLSVGILAIAYRRRRLESWVLARLA
ncbi:MAG: hypothetical protein ACFCU8_06490 [Thermosynechococcaceae cyanobacterium]